MVFFLSTPHHTPHRKSDWLGQVGLPLNANNTALTLVMVPNGRFNEASSIVRHGKTRRRAAHWGAPRLAGDDVRGHEPSAQRKMAAMHHRAGCHRGLSSAPRTFPGGADHGSMPSLCEPRKPGRRPPQVGEPTVHKGCYAYLIESSSSIPSSVRASLIRSNLIMFSMLPST